MDAKHEHQLAKLFENLASLNCQPDLKKSLMAAINGTTKSSQALATLSQDWGANMGALDSFGTVGAADVVHKLLVVFTVELLETKKLTHDSGQLLMASLGMLARLSTAELPAPETPLVDAKPMAPPTTRVRANKKTVH